MVVGREAKGGGRRKKRRNVEKEGRKPGMAGGKGAWEKEAFSTV